MYFHLHDPELVTRILTFAATNLKTHVPSLAHCSPIRLVLSIGMQGYSRGDN